MSDQMQDPPGWDLQSERAPSEPLTQDLDDPVDPERWLKTDKYLRGQLGLSPEKRVDLWAIPDPPPGQKPDQPLSTLVKLAIHGSEKGLLTLQEIYQALQNRFEYFAQSKASTWKNSIRHNLSLNLVFRSHARPIDDPGQGRYWSLDISNGEGYKRERRRKRRNRKNYVNTTPDLLQDTDRPSNRGDSSKYDNDLLGSGLGTGGRNAPSFSRRGRPRPAPYAPAAIIQPSSSGPAAGAATSSVGHASSSAAPTQQEFHNSSYQQLENSATHINLSTLVQPILHQQNQHQNNQDVSDQSVLPAALFFPTGPTFICKDGESNGDETMYWHLNME
ncbi:hypothetical protein NP233_g3385 [Leucocoprinus birnbaumii]|uniref:Fork-head domain-containing protein n=1 Tax=Leucocoprinus birnbaumii TaxID=56174 RepID=A0AAD5YWG5_9AGAR|nr:hypothetical protein NP233_g3385 [Leucocoprinus birnbaumii]